MDTINIKKEFAGDWISREAGERLRKMIVERMGKNKKLEIDFSNVVIASTSFFDEGIAKLSEEGWTKEDLHSHIRFKNLHYKDRAVLDELCKNRGV